MMDQYDKFLNDIPYDLAVPPQGIAYGKMSNETAKEAFEWYVAAIPSRMDYFRKRCAADLRISIKSLDFSAESLITVWRWFLKTARTEDTPEGELAWMLKGAKVFGESFVTRKVLTVATEFILRDISMYIGECFLKESSKLYWTFSNKPKNSVTVNQPLVAGLVETYNGRSKAKVFAPIHMVGIQASNLLSEDAEETDLFNVYQIWREFIPKE